MDHDAPELYGCPDVWSCIEGLRYRVDISRVLAFRGTHFPGCRLLRIWLLRTPRGRYFSVSDRFALMEGEPSFGLYDRLPVTEWPLGLVKFQPLEPWEAMNEYRWCRFRPVPFEEAFEGVEVPDA